jgi:cell division protein DivIC
MMFFDQYRIPVAISIYSNVAALEKEKLEFQKEIIKVWEDKRDIENNYEKFAREKYYMSRSDEDVFIIENSEFKNRK